MNFWAIVVDELEYQGKTRKWLASEVGIDVSTIGTGLKRKSIPQVDIALRIADALAVPVRYLVTGKNQSTNQEYSIEEDLHIYHKYANTIKNLDKLPEKQRVPIINMIEEMKEGL